MLIGGLLQYTLWLSTFEQNLNRKFPSLASKDANFVSFVIDWENTAVCHASYLDGRDPVASVKVTTLHYNHIFFSFPYCDFYVFHNISQSCGIFWLICISLSLDSNKRNDDTSILFLIHKSELLKTAIFSKWLNKEHERTCRSSSCSDNM